MTEVANADFNQEIDEAKRFVGGAVAIHPEKGKFIVRNNFSMANELPINVDLQARTCSCTRWVQLGVPCRHAVACVRLESDGAMKMEYFYDWTLTTTWKALYQTQSLYLNLPDAESLDLQKSQMLRCDDGSSSSLLLLPLRAPTIKEAQIDSSKMLRKRIKSAGESGPSVKSSCTVGSIEKAQKVCPLCNKLSSLKTKHKCKQLKKDNLIDI